MTRKEADRCRQRIRELTEQLASAVQKLMDYEDAKTTYPDGGARCTCYPSYVSKPCPFHGTDA